MLEMLNSGKFNGKYYRIDEVAEMFYNWVGDNIPCNYNGLDNNTDNRWCEIHCKSSIDMDKKDMLNCWIHAIESGWLDD